MGLIMAYLRLERAGRGNSLTELDRAVIALLKMLVA